MSEEVKKHIRVIIYLALSGLIAYGASVYANDPRIMYAMPLINYVLYALNSALMKEGVLETLMK